MNKKIFFVLGILLFLSFSFISAQPPFQQTTAENSILIESPVIEYLQANNDFEFHIHAHNSSNGLLLSNDTTYCIFHLYNSTSGNHLIEDNMTFDDNDIDFFYLVSGGNFSSLKQHAVLFYCEVPGERGGFFEYGFDVTPTGSPSNNIQLYSRIFLILLFISLIFIIQWNQKRINYDKWYNKIAEKYKTKNTFRWVLGAVGYNIFKNSYIFSYLVGLLGLLVLTELTVFFNITSVIQIMKIVLGIYTLGALAVVIVFFSQVQEWIFQWKEDLEKINWGKDFSYDK